MNEVSEKGRASPLAGGLLTAVAFSWFHLVNAEGQIEGLFVPDSMFTSWRRTFFVLPLRYA